VRWFHADWSRVLGMALLVVSAGWTAVGLVHVWAHPVLGWLPLPVLALLAARACRQVTRRADLDVGTRRFWRQMALASVLFAAGIAANTYDAVGGPVPSQRVGPVTLACYMSVLFVVLWALLRLPSWQRSRSDWTRFGLDACVVLVTSSAFLWHFSLREHSRWMTQTGSAGAMLAICVVAFISMVTFVKVSFAGAGRLDRRAIHILAIGTAGSAMFGGLSPFLIDRPYLSSSLIAVPIAALSIQLAAGRQLGSGDTSPPARRQSRRIGWIPYAAVAATDALLLLIGPGSAGETWFIQCHAVALTALVVIRQVIALRDNNRLFTRLEQYQAELSHSATHDDLTGVANRALFEQRVGALLDAGRSFEVVLLDLDDFKGVNDRLGHGLGDVLITTVSARLTEAVGELGTVARLGGDEFVLLLPRIAPDRLDALLCRLVTVVRRPADLNGHAVVVPASVGVTSSRPGDSPSELLRRADVAMYAAKAAGGDRWDWFDPIMDRLADENARLGADLRRAIDDDQIFLLYQPIVALPGGERLGVEALVRWQHPQHGLISPDVFIPLAERNGYIVELACRQAADWQHRYGERAGRVSINVSARQLAEPGFVAQVAGILEHTGVDGAGLMIEVTETAVLGTGVALDAVHRLKELGLKIALDDFGTGQSSLSLLLDCPVDLLKVDKSFVSGAAAGRAGAVIVEGLIGFTDGLALDAVAEGVETTEQADRLHAAGYRMAQGYLFGRPTTADALDELTDSGLHLAGRQHSTPAYGGR
jgi:diguanylate cyclase (GGDEF)-like protein